MELLPKCHTEFDSPEYWEKFFKRLGSKAFEWYGEYPELCGILHKYIKTSDKILVIGCGNSQLSADLYDVGVTNITNIDVSDVVIRQMTDKNKDRTKMSFIKMDATEMSFDDGEFSVVLDKGTLDALFVSSEPQIVANIEKMFNEIMRTLKFGGRYICISLLQDHILKKLLSYFSQSGWPIRAHRIDKENSSDSTFQLPVFAVICTKFKKIEGMKQILEASSFDSKIERMETEEKLIQYIKEMQYYGILREQISSKSVVDQQVSLCLYSDGASTPRYTLYVVDSLHHSSKKFAIFIAPQGRETDWLFSTENGRIKLSESAGFQRLVVVTLDRHHTYDSLSSIQAELSGKVMELAPPSYKSGTKVPFLSLGDDIGKREVRKQYTSAVSGECVVEDVYTDDGQILRRLIFLKNPNLIQSEAQLVIDGSTSEVRNRRKKGMSVNNEPKLNKSYLACQHHLTMIGGFAFLPTIQNTEKNKKISCLIIGLGGGALPVFIHQYLPELCIDVVDIDPTIVDIARDWFGFKKDKNLTAHVTDGIDYIHKVREEGKKYDVVMFDVDSKDASQGLNCPPKVFVEEDTLHAVKAIMSPEGVFVLNLVCRDEDLKKEILRNVQMVFPSVFHTDIPDEVNDIIFSLVEKSVGSEKTLQKIQDKVKQVHRIIKHNSKQKADVDLVEAMTSLKLCQI